MCWRNTRCGIGSTQWRVPHAARGWRYRQALRPRPFGGPAEVRPIPEEARGAVREGEPASKPLKPMTKKVLGGLESPFPVNATGQVSLRAPSPYVHLCHELAAALNITAGTLLRRSIEHYAQHVATTEIGSEIPDRLISAGQRVRSLPRAGSGRPGTFTSTLAS